MSLTVKVTPRERQRLLRFPKIELHHHLDGALRPKTIMDLAREQNFALPTRSVKKLQSLVTVRPDCSSLVEFLDAFNFFYPLLMVPSAMERAAYEVCEDFARDNIFYAETRFAPVLQAKGDSSMEDMVKAVLKGIRRGKKDFGVDVGVILCTYRMESPESSVETVELAKKYHGRGVVGIDLAGDEYNFPASLHSKALRLAHRYGLPITMHAGEAGPVDNIKEAVNKFKARRIGHGCALATDAKFMKTIIRKNVMLEVCLTSNIHTNTIQSYDAHPFPVFFEAGVPMCLNTDDPGVSDIDLSNEYAVAQKLYGLSWENIEGLVRTGIEHAFVSDARRRKLKATYRNKLKEWKDGYR